MKNKLWVAMFSQTGSEIYNISKRINKFPDRIITNSTDIGLINFNLLEECFDKIYFTKKTPTVEEYETFLPTNSIITMHGWLRIVPPDICSSYEIYNSHPAPLTRYPHLKGKDPQVRTFNEKLQYSGNTIHRCIAELDSGEILFENEISLENETLDSVFIKTHKAATELWLKFLNEKLC